MMAADRPDGRPLGVIVRESLHTVAMECGPFTPEEKRRYAAAELRKTMRREMEQRYAAIREES